MCRTEGKNGAKAKAIFERTDEKCSAYAMRHKNFIAVSVDNANIMIEVKNTVASLFKTFFRWMPLPPSTNSSYPYK